MGQTYKGLTVRIGADASGLTRALRSANGAIKDTQSALRKLDKASKLDPSSMRVFEARVVAVKDQARALTERLAVMGETLAQVKRDPSMRRLAENTEQASLAARHANERYAEVCATIKRFKNELASAAGYDVSKNDPFKGAEGFNETVAVMRKLGVATKETEAEYAKLVDEHDRLLKNKAVTEKVLEFRKLKDDIAATEAEAKSFYRQLAVIAATNPASTKTAEFRKLKDEIGRADSAAAALKKQLQAMEDALRIDPSNLEAAKIRMGTLEEQAHLCADRLKSLNAQMAQLKASGADKASAQFKNLSMEMERAVERDASLNMELEETRKRLAILKEQRAFAETAKDAGRLDNEIEKVTERERALNAEVAETRQKLQAIGDAKAFREVRADIAATVSEMSGLAAKMDQASSKMKMMNGALQQFGWSAYATVTPMVLMFAHKAIQSAEDIDAAYRDMRKTVQGTEKQFEALRKSAIEYSRTHYTTADQLLEIEAIGGQLGVATDKLEDFAKTVSNLDIATDLDTEGAATNLGQLQGILNDMSADDFPKFGDALVRLGNNSATMESRIMNVTTRIASMGTISGFSATELLALATSVASTGQGAESAGTAISKTMSDIESAVGSGGDKLEGFAKVAGMSASQFATTWKNEPVQALVAFIEGLKGIEEQGGSADSTLKNLKINSVRQKQAILGLMQTIDGLNNNLEMSENAWNGVSDQWGQAGDAANEAEAKCQGFSGAIQLLRNNAQVFLAEFADSLAPAIRGLADMVSDLTRHFSELPEGTKVFIAGLVGVAAAAGPVAIGINSINGAIGSWSKMKQSLFSGMSNVATSCRQATEAFQAQAREAAAAAGAAENLTLKAKASAVGMGLATGASKLLAGALKTIAPIAVISGVLAIADAVGQFNERANAGSKVAETLSGAMRDMSGRYKESYVEAEKASKSVAEVTESMQACSEANAQAAEEVAGTWKEYRTSESMLDHYIEVIDRLRDRQIKNKDMQAQLASAVRGYNEITGESVEVIDAANGKINKSSAELARMTAAWKKAAEQQARQQVYQKMLERVIETDMELQEVERKRKEIEDGLADNSKLVDAMQGNIAGYVTAQMELNDLNSQYDSLQEAQEAQRTTLAEAERGMSDYVEQVDSAAQAIPEMTAEQMKAVDAIAELTAEVEEVVAYSPMIADALDKAGMSSEELAARLSVNDQKMDDFVEAVDTGADNIINSFEKIEENTEMTLDKAIENLEYNVKATQNWQANLKTLYERAGDGNKVFIDKIRDMGVQYAPLVQQMVDDTDGDMERLVELMREAGVTATDEMVYEYGNLSPELEAKVAEAMGLVDASLAAGTDPSVATASEQVSDILNEYATLPDSVMFEGEKTSRDWNAGLDNPVENAKRALIAKGWKTQVTNGISSLPLDAGNRALYAAKSYNGGLGNSAQISAMGANAGKWKTTVTGAIATLPASAQGTATSASRNFSAALPLYQGTAKTNAGKMSDAAKSGMTKYSGRFHGWGSESSRSFGSGISSQESYVRTQATSIADVVKRIFGHSVPKEGPLHNGGKGEIEWGTDAILNFANGMEKAQPYLSRVSKDTADIVSNSISAIGADGKSLQVSAVAEYKASIDRASIAAANTAARAMSEANAASAQAISDGNGALAAQVSELTYQVMAMRREMPRAMSEAFPDEIKVDRRTFARLMRESEGAI